MFELKQDSYSSIVQDSETTFKGDIGVISQRKELDLTEKLWILCLEAVHKQDLVDVLTAVVDDIESGDLSPFVLCRLK
jgi:hypothetical protein